MSRLTLALSTILTFACVSSASAQNPAHDAVTTTITPACDSSLKKTDFGTALFSDTIDWDKDNQLFALVQKASLPTNDESQAYIFHVDHWTMNNAAYSLVSSDWYVYRYKDGKSSTDHLIKTSPKANGDPLIYGKKSAMVLSLEIYDTTASPALNISYKTSVTQGTPQNTQALGQLIAALLGISTATASKAPVTCEVAVGTGLQAGTQSLPFTINVAASVAIPGDSGSSKTGTSDQNGNQDTTQKNTPGVADCSSVSKGNPCKFTRTFSSDDKEWWDVSLAVAIPGVRESQYSIANNAVTNKATTHTDMYALFDIYPFFPIATKESPIPHLFAGLPVTGQSLHRPAFGLAENLTSWTGLERHGFPVRMSFFAGVVLMQTQRLSGSPTTPAELTADLKTVRVVKPIFGIEVPVNALVSKIGGKSSKNTNGNGNSSKNGTNANSTGGGSSKVDVADYSAAAKTVDSFVLAAPQSTQQGAFKNAVVQYDAETSQLRKLVGEVNLQAQDPQDAAKKFLNQNMVSLNSTLNPNELRIVQVKESLTGTHLTYQRFRDNIPVLQNDIAFNIGADNSVNVVNNKTSAAVDINSVALPPSTDDRKQVAVAAALGGFENADVINPSIDASLAILAGKATALPVWQVTFLTRRPAGAWRVLVNGSSNTVVSKQNVAVFENGTGQVFRPDPITDLRDTSLKDDAINKGKIDSARVVVTLTNLDKSGQLSGDFATTAPTEKTGYIRAKESTYSFDYLHNDPRFGEVMAYYWVTACQLYLQQLGYTNAGGHDRSINARPIGIDAHFNNDDNSFYSPITHSLQFGDGGIPDSEDAMVILHELAHAIQDAQVPGLSGDTHHTQVRAMGEGFGDYWAASFFGDDSPPEWLVFWDRWDGLPFNAPAGSSPPYLRRLDRPKHYPENWVGEEHADGEIWSACLWQIRAIVGKKRADTMILESHYSLSPGVATFADGANAIIAANRALYSGADEQSIRQVFVDKGILAKP